MTVIKYYGSNEHGPPPPHFDINSLGVHKSQACNRQKDMKGEHALEERALQIYQNCDVTLDLSLQIWNADDRIIRDKDHKSRPISKFEVARKTVFIGEQMSTFNHMNHIQNLYADYA